MVPESGYHAMNEPSPARMRLSGYVPLTLHGFALPAYGAGQHFNAWYIAVAAIEGDHVAPIERFELLEGESVRLLPDADLEVCVGDPWQDVFLWGDRVFAGTPARILEALAVYREDLARVAPLSFLDLALAAEAPLAIELSAKVLAFLEARLGRASGATSFRELVLRPGIRLELHRHLRRRGADVDLPALARDFVVREYEPGRFEAELVPGTAVALGGEPAAAELRTSIARLGDTLGLPLRATGLETNGAVMDVAGAESNPAPMPLVVADEKRSSRALPGILVIVKDWRAVQIARHLEPPRELAFGAGSIWDVRRYRVGPSALASADAVIHIEDALAPSPPLDHYALVIWLAGDPTLRDPTTLERMLTIARAVDRAKDTSFLIAPAPPPDRPSVLSEQDHGAKQILSLADAVIDTTLARSPFWTGQPRRSFDRRMADIVATVGIVAALDDSLREALRRGRGAKRPRVLSFYRGAASRLVPVVAPASELSAGGLRNRGGGDGPHLRTAFEMRDRAGKLVRNAFVEIHPLEEDFEAFAEAAVLEALRPVAQMDIMVTITHVPSEVRRALEQPRMAMAVRSHEKSGNAMVITGEAPDLKALRAAEKVDAAVVRYTDRNTIRRLFDDNSPPFRPLPTEIRLPPPHLYARNRGLATRGVGARDVVRLPGRRWHELLRRHGRSELDGQERRYVAAIDMHGLEPEIALPVRAVWDAMNLGDSLARTIVKESPSLRHEHATVGNRVSDLAAAWSRPSGDGRRWIIEDGRIPVEMKPLERDEVPAQRLLLIDGDGAVPALLMSRLFEVWARALLSKSTSWSSRFPVGKTFDGFPLSSSFRVVPAEDGSPPQLRFSRRSARLAEMLHYGAGLLGEETHEHGSDERALRRTPAMREIDALLLADIELGPEASDLDILERLFEPDRGDTRSAN
jgi:hypothetical protein